MADDVDKRQVVLWLIAEDMYRDTIAMDGKPLTGRVVGEAFGEVRAAVMHLAVTLESIRVDVAALTDVLAEDVARDQEIGR